MVSAFSFISQINPDNKQSWQGQSCLSLDIDWAHDDVINDAIDLIEKADIPVTWFVTHDTPVLNRLKENPNFELGIHPNFNFLLQGDDRNGKDAAGVIGRLMDLLPDARVVRSHSATQSSYIFQLFAAAGLTHDANCFIPYTSNIDLKPWRYWNNLVATPYLWADDVACTTQNVQSPPTLAQNARNTQSLSVFDFHPIHVYLNTEDMQRYEDTRALHRNPDALAAHRYNGGDLTGSRDHLKALLGLEGEK